MEEICSWLPPGLDGRKVCSQEHISLINMQVDMNCFYYGLSFIVVDIYFNNVHVCVLVCVCLCIFVL